MEAITDSNFEEKTSKGLVLVDFWAEWCGPCRMLTPILEELQKEYGEKLEIKKLNVDENQAIAQKLSVASIPTLVLYRNGEIVDRSVGVLPKPQLKSMIDSHIA
jgi:thioredoxin 1